MDSNLKLKTNYKLVFFSFLLIAFSVSFSFAKQIIFKGCIKELRSVLLISHLRKSGNI